MDNMKCNKELFKLRTDASLCSIVNIDNMHQGPDAIQEEINRTIYYVKLYLEEVNRKFLKKLKNFLLLVLNLG